MDLYWNQERLELLQKLRMENRDWKEVHLWDNQNHQSIMEFPNRKVWETALLAKHSNAQPMHLSFGKTGGGWGCDN